jgi:hypothetical protein
MSWAFVQGKEGAVSQASNFTIVLPGNTVAGDTIIVMFNQDVGGTPSVTDSQGNTYTSCGTQPSISLPTTEVFFIFTAPVSSSAACTININVGGATVRTSWALEYSGLVSNPYDVQSATANSANDCVTGAMTTAATNELVISYFAAATSPTFTFGSGTTRLTNTNNQICQDQNQASAGSVNPQATASSVSGTYRVGAYGATFKQTAAAGGVRRSGFDGGFRGI